MELNPKALDLNPALLGSAAALLPAHYARSAPAAIVSASTAPGRRSLVTPADLALDLGGSALTIPQVTIDLDVPANWDSAYTSYATAANRAGKDVYLYATASGLILSPNATVPTGYTVANSRKIGGFHCVPGDIVGVGDSHGAFGFVAGDIAYPSIWDLIHRPVCAPEGMCWDPKVQLWVDAWLQSGTGVSTSSVVGATITNAREQYNHALDFAAVGKRMLEIAEFEVTAAGSPEGVNVSGSAEQTITGATLASNGVSQVSDRFCWQMTGVKFQWCRDTSYKNDDAGYVGTWSWKTTGGAGNQYTQGAASSRAGLLAGGRNYDGVNAGTRCVTAFYIRSYVATTLFSSRGCAATAGGAR